MFASNDDYEVMMRMRSEALLSVLYFIDFKLTKNKIQNQSTKKI